MKNLNRDGIAEMDRLDRMESMNARGRITSDYIKTLKPGEVFVFGSNRQGWHGGGAAAMAHMYFGAVWGQGGGLQGCSYAIPTMEAGIDAVGWYVDEFIAFARENPEKHFLVTEIGCGVAGFSPQEIAPLFHDAIAMDNVSLPRSFWEVINESIDEQ